MYDFDKCNFRVRTHQKNVQITFNFLFFYVRHFGLLLYQRNSEEITRCCFLFDEKNSCLTTTTIYVKKHFFSFIV